jgi:hypothetical protein
MPQTVQDLPRERIDIVDQPEGMDEKKKKGFWLRIPIALVALVALFFLVRRLTSRKEI